MFKKLKSKIDRIATAKQAVGFRYDLNIESVHGLISDTKEVETCVIWTRGGKKKATSWTLVQPGETSAVWKETISQNVTLYRDSKPPYKFAPKVYTLTVRCKFIELGKVVSHTLGELSLDISKYASTEATAEKTVLPFSLMYKGYSNTCANLNLIVKSQWIKDLNVEDMDIDQLTNVSEAQSDGSSSNVNNSVSYNKRPNIQEGLSQWEVDMELLKKENKKAAEVLASAESAIDNCFDKMDTFDFEIDGKLDMIGLKIDNNITKRLKQLQRQVACTVKLREDYDNLKILKETSEFEFIREIDNMKVERTNLQNQVGLLESQLKCNSEEVSEEKSETVTALPARLGNEGGAEDWSAKVEELTGEVERLQSQLEESDKKISELNEERSLHSNDMNNVDSNIVHKQEDLILKLDKNEQQISHLESELKLLSQAKEEAEASLNEALEAQRHTNEELQGTCEKLEGQVTSGQHDLETSAATIASLQAQVQSLEDAKLTFAETTGSLESQSKEEIQRLEGELKLLSQAKEEAEASLNEALEAQRHTNEELQGTCEKLEGQVTSGQHDLETSAATIASLQAQVQSLEDSKISLEGNLTSATTQVEELSKSLNEKTKPTSHMDSESKDNEDIAALKAQVGALESELTFLRLANDSGSDFASSATIPEASPAQDSFKEVTGGSIAHGHEHEKANNDSSDTAEMLNKLIQQKTVLQEENDYLINELTEAKIELAQLKEMSDRK